MMRAITASSWRDHPRSRGVYMARLGREEKREGSSPLARGLPHRLGVEFIERGIIPARAGFTAATRPTHRAQPGSSPLARGLLRRQPHLLRDFGIIPARAGFTLPRLLLRRWSRDHPRSRGVYGTPLAPLIGTAGSSPLARGLRLLRMGGMRILGIIPARAGFTPLSTRPARRSTDHPRSRGVYECYYRSQGTASGSSPLARGLLPTTPKSLPLSGIIPARAGFTRSLPPTWSSMRGSSPLARGLPLLPCLVVRVHRIIPARAGFTSRTGWTTQRIGDHPRSRGVYRGHGGEARADRGSSPLARGLLRSPPLQVAASGSSPLARGLLVTPALSRRALGSSPLARGLPSSAPCPKRLCLDHPRSRGVYPYKTPPLVG